MNRKMKNKPLITIITPILNGEKYLDECIQSILRQNYENVEHLFIDGGSTDNSHAILRSYISKYPRRIRLVIDEGTNAREAWNTGWKVAHGDIFGFLGDDDIMAPEALSIVADFFSINPDAYFVYGACNYIDKNGKFLRKHPERDFNLDEAINHESYIPTTSAFYRAELIHNIGPMDPTYNICDFDYWLRSAHKYTLYRIPQVLSSFRMHEGSITASKGHIIYAKEALLISQKNGKVRILSIRRIVYYAISLVEFFRPLIGWSYPYLHPFIMDVVYPFYLNKIFPLMMFPSRVIKSLKNRAHTRK